MSGDKRSVITDALETLGTIIDENAARDAIHVAVEPVVATEKLWPGQHIALTSGGAVQADGGEGIGIVDPFLEGPVQPGQRFWLLIYPRMITSLRHVWAHPEFDDVADPKMETNKAASEEWLREFVANSDCPDYETTIAAALSTGDYGYVLISGQDASGEIPDEFWDHLEVVTGRKIPHGSRAYHFSCSC